MLWKICSTNYIAVTMSVYSFYWVKSRLVNSVPWVGKKRFGCVVVTMILMMGLLGLCFFWLPIQNVQYNGILINGECHLVKRRWIAILWVSGDSVLSVFLLVLFIRPLQVLKENLGDTPRSVATLRSMVRLTEKNRNLLLCTVTVTIGLYTTIAVVGNLTMPTVIYMCAIDRLVTLQCITMTFSYDRRDYFWCCTCLLCKNREPEIEQNDQEEHSLSVEIPSRNSVSSSLVFMSSTSNFVTDEKMPV